MSPGIRVTVGFDGPGVCPIVDLSATAGTTINQVSTNVCGSGCTESVTEFSLKTDNEVEIPPSVSRVFADRYRLIHGEGVNCPCEALGRFGCPVARYVAQDDRLTIVFYAADYDRLREIIAGLRERFPGMEIEQFLRSPVREHVQDPVAVDRNRLTDRQLEILETAHEMGYFDRPREANATEIAAELGINPSTFREHLAAAESKILADFL